MLDIIYTTILAVVQGLTEFLPVSSTGHLILLEKFLNLSPDKYGLSFDVALHIGTLLALLMYFRGKIKSIIKDIVHKKTHVLLLLIIGTIPAAIIGLSVEELLDSYLRNTQVVASMLIIFSFIFWYAEKVSRENKNIQNLNKLDVLIIGFFQAIALIPGVSRSGITMSGGLFRNLSKEQAGEFTFLLSIPIITLASAKGVYDLATTDSELNALVLGLGIIVSGATGYICIKYFLNYLKKHSLLPFILYRLILGTTILLIPQ